MRRCCINIILLLCVGILPVKSQLKVSAQFSRYSGGDGMEHLQAVLTLENSVKMRVLIMNDASRGVFFRLYDDQGAQLYESQRFKLRDVPETTLVIEKKGQMVIPLELTPGGLIPDDTPALQNYAKIEVFYELLFQKEDELNFRPNFGSYVQARGAIGKVQ